jgi:hypothetical protein
MTDRSIGLALADDLTTEATSGSSITVTTSPPSRLANRLGLAVA